MKENSTLREEGRLRQFPKKQKGEITLSKEASIPIFPLSRLHSRGTRPQYLRYTKIELEWNRVEDDPV